MCKGKVSLIKSLKSNDDIKSINALIDFYGKIGDVDNAINTF